MPKLLSSIDVNGKFSLMNESSQHIFLENKFCKFYCICFIDYFSQNILYISQLHLNFGFSFCSLCASLTFLFIFKLIKNNTLFDEPI